MAVFNPGDKHETAEGKIEVTVSPNSPIGVGTHRFQLVVVDNDGNESAPSIAEVLVRDLQKPTAKLEIQPRSVEFGKSFALVGSESSDIAPGTIKKFIWTRLD
jgi:hypothetical protein